MKPRRRLAAVATCMLLCVPLVATVPGSSHAAPSRADLERAQERLHALERDFELVAERYNLVAERLDDIRMQIAVTAGEVDRIERRLGVKEDAAVRLAQALYSGGATLGVETILASQSLNDMETRVAYLEASQTEQVKIFETLSVDRRDLESKIDELEEARGRAATEKARLDGLRQRAEEKIAQQSDEIERLTDLIEQARRRAERSRQAAAISLPPPPAGVSADPAPAPNERAGVAVEAALSQVGKPYRWGASGPDSYDCSGLTMWAWAQAGVGLPHNSGMQYAATPRVSREELQPGDLVFFGSPIHHVAMYIGNGQMVEAPYSGSQVRVVPFGRSDYVGAGRPGG